MSRNTLAKAIRAGMLDSRKCLGATISSDGSFPTDGTCGALCECRGSYQGTTAGHTAMYRDSLERVPVRSLKHRLHKQPREREEKSL